MFKSKSIKEACQLVKGAKRLLAYRRDLVPQAKVDDILARIEGLKQAIKSGKVNPAEVQALEKACIEISPNRPHAGWRENVEVILVALVLAVGIRAYFLQPFKIPTGSMQPTLNGIIGYPTETPPPGIAQRVLDQVIFGRSWVDITAKTDDRIVMIVPRVQNLFVTRTEIITERGSYMVSMLPATLKDYFKVHPGKPIRAGEPIVRGFVDTGDQVFVDKMSYHFVKPSRGDVFVFKTTNIKRIESTLDPAMGAQFYIKRLAGMPGDLLRIDPPDLLVDGEVATEFGLARVMSDENGYRGYSNGSASGSSFPLLGSPEATFKVPDDGYFALGDNSFNSSDSRDWGAVPEMNVVGRGFVVYWPFTKHWGLIH